MAVSLVSLSNGGSTQTGLFPLAAKLFRDGRLEPELATASSPWIPSERLESPSVSGRNVMVGSLDDFWRPCRTELRADMSQSGTFAEAMALATELFEEVADESIEDFAARQHQRGEFIEHELCYVQETNRINASGGLLETAKNSCGSRSDRFPLTDSQRRAMHAFLGEAGSEITVVRGPPDTGTTTMLQAIVANLLTRYALDKAAPPVIVGTSTNNQAVTNILSSFASSGAWTFRIDDGTARWDLPRLRDDGASAGVS